MSRRLTTILIVPLLALGITFAGLSFPKTHAAQSLPSGCTKTQGTITCVTPTTQVGNSSNYKGGSTTTSQGNLTNKKQSTPTCSKPNGACQP